MRHAVATAQCVTPDRIVVVVGAHGQRVRSAVRRYDREARVVNNPRWRDGMSSSLQAGLAALPGRAAAALLLPVDQPLLTPAALCRLAGRWSRRPLRLAAASYGGRLGIPAVIPRHYWARARHLRGDVGARDLLRRPGRAITSVDLPAASFDIDTADDLAGLPPLRPGSG